MAHVIQKSQQAPALSYPELAQIYDAAIQGNAAARIALAQMPATERNLAAMLHESFSGGVKKNRKPKRKPKTLTKAEKRAIKAQRPSALAATFQAIVASTDNPHDRETARKLLESL